MRIRHLKTSFAKRAKYPKFKKQKRKTIQCTSVSVGGNWIKVPKCNPIKAVIHRLILGVVRSITVTKDRVGDYYASVLCETGEKRT